MRPFPRQCALLYLSWDLIWFRPFVPPGRPEEFVGAGPEDWDAFHGLILTDEMSRCGSGGFVWGLCGGLGIGLPPVLHFGSDYLKQKVIVFL